MNDATPRTISERLDALEVAVKDVQHALYLHELHGSDPAEGVSSTDMERDDLVNNPVDNAFIAAEPNPISADYQSGLSSIGAASMALDFYEGRQLRAPDDAQTGQPFDETFQHSSERPELAEYAELPKLPAFAKQLHEGPTLRSHASGAAAQPFNFSRTLPKTNFDIVRDTAFWLSKVGIVLFLFGVVFLFKYTVDRHWLNEQARVGAGLLLGSLLLAAGLLIHQQRRNLSQVLMGGSIATYYITAYAGYQLFPSLLMSYEQTFFFMSVVTLLALVLSVYKGEIILALIGLLGGILTPFALGMTQVALPALMGYTCLLLGATGAIYLFRGWRSLLWCGLVGGWAILVASYSHWVFRPVWDPAGVAYSDRVVLQGAVAFLLLAFWAIPVMREVLCARDPSRWPRSLLPSFLTNSSANWDLFNSQAQILSALIPLSALFFSTAVWGELVSKETWGLVELAGAGLFVAVFFVIRRLGKEETGAPAASSNTTRRAVSGAISQQPTWGTLSALAHTQAMMAVVLFTLSLLTLLEGNQLLLALVGEAVVLHVISHRFPDRGSTLAGHLIFGAVGIWLAVRILVDRALEPTAALTNARALTDLLAMALAFGVSFLLRNEKSALIYRSAVHAAVMGWLWRELHVFPDGDGYVMLAWAAYGMLLHLVSRRLGDRLNLIGTSIAAHLAFEGSMGLLALRLAQGYEGAVPMFNGHAAIDLVVIGMALASSFVVKQKSIANFYRVAVHVAVLGWFWREAADIDGWHGHGYVMLRWTVYLLMVALVSHKIGDRVSLAFINVPYALVAAMLGLRILGEHGGTSPLLNATTAIDLLVVCLALPASFVVQPRIASTVMRVVIHGIVLGVLWRELSWLQHGLDFVVLAWALYAAGVQAVAWWRKDHSTSTVAHVIFALSGVGLLALIAHGLYFINEDRPVIFTQVGLANLGVIATGALIYFLVRKQKLAIFYGLWLHVAFLGWTWQELGLIPNGGNGYVTIAWGAYAIVLVLTGLGMERSKPLLYCGVSTLFIVAGKLFLIDLRYLEAVWRILLFLGFGGLFLLLSYFFQGVNKRGDETGSAWDVSRLADS